MIPADAPPGRGAPARGTPAGPRAHRAADAGPEGGAGGRRTGASPADGRPDRPGDLRARRTPDPGAARTARAGSTPGLPRRDRTRARPGARAAVPGRRPGPPLSGGLRRFVARWGWRAYAIPLLTVATLVTLADLAVTGPAPAATPAAAPPSASAPALPATDAAPPPAEPAPSVEGDAAPAATPDPAAGSAPYVEKGAGTLAVVAGTSDVHGTGPLRRFVVEVEDGIGVDGAAFAAAVEAILGDPRSWGHGGRMSFQRVGAEEAAAGAYDFRVSLVSPGSTEAYCPGLGTGGYTSCRYGERAVINLARWETAVPDYQGDVAAYRQYVVNHEVGHALGNGHQPCPGPGQLAPVMQQQTLGLQGCAKNPWPFP